MRRYIIPLIMLLTLSLTAQAQKTSDHNFEVAKHLDIFNNVYKNLELLYVDTLKPKETIGVGITAMLRSLDPYTEYYAQDETKDLRMMLTGKYAGIGALIRKHQKLDRVVIDEPYANMPAAEAGLKKGDVILSIDDSMMTTKPVGYVSDHLRGEPGTSFLLKVMRPSTGKLMSFKITRRNIKLPEMPYYGIREGNIGYISLNQFTEGCAKEMRRVFVDLKKQGATSLILDLRGNGGGSQLIDGAGIPSDKLKDRIIQSTDVDLRYYLMKYIEEHHTISPKALGQWKLVPEKWVAPAIKRDYKLLFGEDMK